MLDHIVDAANVLSGQRPGARREMLETYVQRLGDLEKIATQLRRRREAFAIQAGREVRVLVENSQVTDEQARLLSKDIARKVEAELALSGADQGRRDPRDAGHRLREVGDPEGAGRGPGTGRRSRSALEGVSHESACGV